MIVLLRVSGERTPNDRASRRTSRPSNVGPGDYQHGTALWKYMTQYTFRLS